VAAKIASIGDPAACRIGRANDPSSFGRMNAGR